MASRLPPSYVAILLLVVLFLAPTTKGEDFSSDNKNHHHLNVYEEELKPCSSGGMALTGYTRPGYCIDQSDDSGSHHICMDLSSLANNQNANFCTVTGQYEHLCSSEYMPCHEDFYDAFCPVTNWCVSQWAFAAYVQKWGCENIQSVVCDAINVEAFYAYQEMASYWTNDHQKYKTALYCLVEKCGFTESSKLRLVLGSPASRFAVLFALAGAAMLVTHWYRKRSMQSRRIDLNQDNVKMETDDNKLAFNHALISLI